MLCESIASQLTDLLKTLAYLVKKLHSIPVAALFKNDKDTAEIYIKKLQEDLLLNNDTGKVANWLNSYIVELVNLLIV